MNNRMGIYLRVYTESVHYVEVILQEGIKPPLSSIKVGGYVRVHESIHP